MSEVLGPVLFSLPFAFLAIHRVISHMQMVQRMTGDMLNLYSEHLTILEDRVEHLERICRHDSLHVSRQSIKIP